MLFCGNFSILELYSLYQLVWNKMYYHNSARGERTKIHFLFTLCVLCGLTRRSADHPHSGIQVDEVASISDVAHCHA